MDSPNASLDGGKYSVLEFFCHAEFLRYFYVTSSNMNENDWKMKIGSIPRTEKLYNRQKSQLSNLLAKSDKITIIKRKIAVSKNSISVTISCSS